MSSIWTKETQLPQFPRLEKSVQTDVLVIGGGIAGILCASALKRNGIGCIVAEANRIGSGVTKNTTAKITSQHGLLYAQLLKKHGEKQAKLYLEANQRALERYRALCGEADCDFEELDSFVYSLTDRKKLEEEVEALHTLGVNACLEDSLPLPFSTAGAVRFPHQAQMNPLKLLSFLANGLEVYENTRVRELKGTTAVTDLGTIRAGKIIVATHFPFLNKHGSYFVKLYQHRSYAIALENAPNYGGMFVDEAEKGMSFRNYGRYLFLLGGDHRTGKKGGNWQELREFAARHYPEARECGRWATQDCMSLDGVPYIGRYSKGMPGVYVATGFNKWGMTSSMVAAELLTDLVLGRETPLEEVFSPSRSIWKPQLAVNALEAAANLLVPTVRRCPQMEQGRALLGLPLPRLEI